MKKYKSRYISFFAKIEALCKEYNLSISHEDKHGAFIIEEYKEENIKWFNEALMKG